MAGLTLIEKIATAHAVGLRPGQSARSGEIITIRPRHVMTHDNTSAVMSKFAEVFKASEGKGDAGPEPPGAKVRVETKPHPRIHNPRQPVFAIDHDIQNLSPENLGKYAKIEAFARQHGIDFYPAGTGISHQVMVEYGYATPGTMVVGSDSHSNLYGAVNCLGTPVVRTDAAAIWATGETWWQVPPVARVNLTGTLKRGVVGKDVIIALCGVFNSDEVLNHAVEFAGDGIHQLTMDQRMSIANMTTEWGALAGVFPFDDVLRDYLYGRADFLARLHPSPPGRGAGGEGAGSMHSRRPTKTPLDPEYLTSARSLRKTQTDAEGLVWFLLRDRRLGDFKFHRQHPVDPYVLDFFCAEANLAIELDGGQHNSPAVKEKDDERSWFLEQKGIRVLRFWDHDVLKDTEAVLEAIWNALQKARPSPPAPLPEGEGSHPRFTRADVDRWWNEKIEADPEAQYAVELTLDLSTVIPHVSGPDDVKTMSSLPEIEAQRVKVNKAYLLSCVNARLEDLNEAASIVRGKKVAPGVEFYVAAASANVQQQAEANGAWQTLVEAGAIPLPSGCGPCIGLGRGTLEPGEVAISATNRNFKGRMGSREAQAYLGSPGVVAASAIAGYICAPDRFDEVKPRFTVKILPSPPGRGAGGEGESPRAGAEIIPGFPRTISGRAVLLPIDNLNTDGIYSGKLTYRDDVSDTEMAAACFNNYDPEFVKKARPGDIVIAGKNFGTGSSREQAATCLQKFGIPCVIAASFSETYKRNAFNNGFIVFECAEFVSHLRTLLSREPEASAADNSPALEGGGQGVGEPSAEVSRATHPPSPSLEGKGSSALTILGPTITIDFARGVIECDGREFTFAPLSPTAQELVVAGGAENVVKRRLGAASRS